MFVRVHLIEVIGVEEGRVNADGVNACGARHAHVVEGVAEVGGFGWCGGVAKRGEPASQWRRVGLLLNRVVAIHRRADEVGNPSAAELPTEAVAEHEAILEALRQRDGDRLAHLLHSHLEHKQAVVQASLNGAEAVEAAD